MSDTNVRGTAETVTTLRTGSGLTQDELADRLYVSRSLVSMWELGARVPDHANVVKLAELFGVNAADIVPGEAYSYSSGSELDKLFEEIGEFTEETGVKPGHGEIDTKTIILKFLTELAQKDRDIFMNRYFSAKTHKAIASEHKMSEAAVKVRLARIRKRLKKYAEGEMRDDK